MPHPNPRTQRRALLVIGVVGALVTAAVVLYVARSPLHGPAAPYDHPGFAESSAATEQVNSGQAATVVAGLREQGYWCVQPRSNDRAVQIDCRAADRSVQVDLEAARNGDVLYADIDLHPIGPTEIGAPKRRDMLWAVLDASFLRLWPGERAVVEGLLEDAQPYVFMGGDPTPPADADDQWVTHEKRTGTASWSLSSFYTGTPLALRVRTSGLQDHSWPFGGSHYAATLSSATDQLTADGFDCATSCYRATDNQTVRFQTHDDQIVSIEFTLRTRSDDDLADDPAGAWVRAGLPFLTPAVRTAVSERIERSRLQHRDWHGVVAGTPLDIVAESGASLTPDDHPARDLSIVIGIPLLRVE